MSGELSMSSGKVIIVGAGVAGLSLAIMLAEQNIESQVLESRQRFDGPTSGVRISGEGVKVLRSHEGGLDRRGHRESRHAFWWPVRQLFRPGSATPPQSWSQGWHFTNN